MTDFRIERIHKDQGVPGPEVLALLRAAFGGADTLWPADRRWLARSGGRLVSHVAVQARWFVIGGRYLQGWFVGSVCTAPAEQNKGLASQLMAAAHDDLGDEGLGFAVLNCGQTMVGFYERFGYTTIADRATYLRNNKAVVDEDPALAFSFRPDFDVAVLKCDSFPFGFDF